MNCIYRSRQDSTVESPSLDDWIEHSGSKFRSEPFRTFSIELASGTWLLMTEQVTEDGHVISICSDITRRKRWRMPCASPARSCSGWP